MNRKYLVLLAMTAVAAATQAPVLLIPNHLFVMYAWFPASIILLVFPLATTLAVRRLGMGAKVLLTIGVVASLFAESRFLPIQRTWYRYNHEVNVATLRSLPYVGNQIRPGDRVLVSGRLNAYTPFKNDKLIARYFPQGVDWRVMVAPADDPLIPMSPDTSKFVKLSDPDVGEFDLHVAYDDRGNVVYVGEVDPRIVSSETDAAVRAGLLLCHGEGR